MLKLKLAKTERERDEAVAGRIAAEESHEATKNSISSTLFDFYLHSVLGHGSLAFLGPKYEITLAEVWEAALDMLGGKGAGYAESALEEHYLDDEARAALAKGKEQLTKVRAGMAEGERSEKEIPPTTSERPLVSSEVDITGPSAHLPPPTRTGVITPTDEEALEDIGAQNYEIELTKPTSSGNFDIGPIQVDYLLIPQKFDELLDYLLNLDEPISPFFREDTNIFNFSSSAVETTSAVQTSPSLVIPPPSLQVTPPSASQPGSQEEQIEALHGLDDPIASQEQKDEGLEGGEISPERTPSDDVVLSALVTPGSESSSKRRKKHGTSKRRGKKIIATEEEPEVAPVAPPSPSSLMPIDRPEKLIIRLGKWSKGGKKK